MKKEELKISERYGMVVSGKLVTVRLDKITVQNRKRHGLKNRTAYECLNLSTGKTVVRYSPLGFRHLPKDEPCSNVKRCQSDIDHVMQEGEECGPKSSSTGSAKTKSNTSSENSSPVSARSADIRPSSDAAPERAAAGSREEGEKRADPTTTAKIPQTGSTTSQPTGNTTAPGKLATADTAENSMTNPLSGLAVVGSDGGTADDGESLTVEQQSILDIGQQVVCLRRGGVIVVCAGAGTGKTFICTKLENVLEGQGQYTAFNSSLVNDGKKKFKKAKVNTTHSLAFGAVGRDFAARLNGRRIRSEQVAHILGISPLSLKVPGVEKPKVLASGFLAGQVLACVRKFCQSDAREIQVGHFRHIDGIDESGVRDNESIVRSYLLPYARLAWEDLSRTTGSLPFTHDCYVKLWQLGYEGRPPYIAADYIMLDEYQDTAPVFLDILKQQTHATLIMVGDDNQRIYEWRGAVNAASEFPDAPRRLLSQSFRFGQAVADVANSILNHLTEKTDLVMKGFTAIPSLVGRLDKPHCVLCRTNAAAIATLLQGKEEGRSVHLIGDIKQLIAFFKAAKDLKAGRSTSYEDLACFSNWHEVEEYAKTAEGEELALMVRLVKEFGVDDILASLETMPDEKNADLVVCTAHKSKGREWKTVKLAGDFPTLDRMDDADVKLLYVAATRARGILDVSGCPPFLSGQQDRQGNPVPHIRIKYTSDLPTLDEVKEYHKITDNPSEERQATNASVDSEADTVTDEKPASKVPQVGKFTWANVDGKWRIRGPRGHANTIVPIEKKGGVIDEERIGEVYREFSESNKR